MTIKFRQTPWVFISSVGEECKPFRESATRASLRSRFFPVKMETWSAEARNSYEACKRHLSECNVMILILTDRYGSIHTESGKSYTEMEYDAALELGIPVLAFLSEHPTLTTDTLDPGDLKRAKKFRERLGTSIQGRFNTADHLELLVHQSLQEWLNDYIKISLKHDHESKTVITEDNIGSKKASLDLSAFQRLQEIINSDWIRDFDYVQLNIPQYVRKEIRGNLIDYCYASDKPENEFFNEKIINIHNKFIKSIKSFLNGIAEVTISRDYNDDALIIKAKASGWITDYDKQYDREVKIITGRGESIIQAYRNFIRVCRQEGIFK